MNNQLKQFNTILEIREFIADCKKRNKTIGLVPTMGALHQGHLSLIESAKKQVDVVVVSIFVNKAQFNDVKDYKIYPRDINSDKNLLSKSGVNVLFTPNDNEIYCDDFGFKIVPNLMVDCLCGKYREGHFEGVSLIVTKLFNIIEPNFAFFGTKDFQQLSIIKKLVKDLNYNIDIIAIETVREPSGLAMSSRNQRLSDLAKIKATMIYQILNEIKNNPQLIEQKKQQLLDNGFEKIEYLEIREEENLKLNMNLNSTKKRRVFIAVYLEGVRLIDNLAI